AMIGYALGRLAVRDNLSRVFILSDSWPLQACIKDFVNRDFPQGVTPVGVTMCFFSDVIDQRWHRVFRETDPEKLDFLDLGREEGLFNRLRPMTRKEEDVLDLL